MSRRGLSSRRARGRDRRHDRLHDRAGAGQPAAVREAARYAVDHGRGRSRRPGLQRPDQIRRPGLHGGGGRSEAAAKGWEVKPDGDNWRRVVPSPLPKRIFQLRPIEWLLDKGTVVIAAGGGGIPTMYETGRNAIWSVSNASSTRTAPPPSSPRRSAPTSSSCATDADAVYLDWGKPDRGAIRSGNAGRAGSVRVSRRIDGAQGRGSAGLCARDRRARRSSARCRRAGGGAWREGNDGGYGDRRDALRLKQKRLIPRPDSSSCVQRPLHRGGLCAGVLSSVRASPEHANQQDLAACRAEALGGRAPSSVRRASAQRFSRKELDQVARCMKTKGRPGSMTRNAPPTSWALFMFRKTLSLDQCLRRRAADARLSGQSPGSVTSSQLSSGLKLLSWRDLRRVWAEVLLVDGAVFIEQRNVSLRCGHTRRGSQSPRSQRSCCH